jgi:hypothetical protein
MSKPGDVERAREIVEDLFDCPPVTESELEQRLSGASPRSMQQALFEHLEKKEIEPDVFFLFLDMFRSVGAESVKKQLLDLAMNKKASTDARALAVAVLELNTPEVTPRLIRQLPPEVVERLNELPLIERVTTILADAREASTLVDLMMQGPVDMRRVIQQDLERVRRRMGAPAALVYAYALRERELKPLHQAMLDAVVEDGGPLSTALLEALRDETTDEKAARAIQKALLSIRTREIEKPPEEPAGTAFLGSCDGQGAFVMFAYLETAGGSGTTVDLCIRAGQEIRDGFVVPRHSREGLAGMMGDLEQNAHLEFREIPLGLAIEIAVAARRWTGEMGVPVPLEAQPPLALLERHARRGDIDPYARVEPAPSLSHADLERVLARPTYVHWVFDATDLIDAGMGAPRGQPDDAWVTRALRSLDTPANRRRVVGMAQHMALWHSVGGDHEAAGVLAAAARATRQDFTASPLPRLLVDRLFHGPLPGPEGVVSRQELGDPRIRQSLKAKFFQHVERPTARDLATLDFTELLESEKESIMAPIPGARMPRDEQQVAIVHAIAIKLGEEMFTDDASIVEQEKRKLERRIVRDTRLTEPDAAHIIDECFDIVFEFAREVCDDCPIHCLDLSPEEDVSEAYHSPRHPAAAVLAKLEDHDGGALWKDDDRDDVDKSFDFHQAVDDDHEAEDYRAELMERFARSPEGEAAEQRADLSVADLFMQFARSYHGCTPATMSPGEVEDVVFNLFPRKAEIDAEEAGEVIGVLRAFWRFLKREHDARNADRCLGVLDGQGAVRRLATKLSDSSNFGMAKSFFMEGAARGFDLSNEEGLQEWVSAYNAELAGGPMKDGFLGLIGASPGEPSRGPRSAASQSHPPKRKKKPHGKKRGKKRR